MVKIGYYCKLKLKNIFVNYIFLLKYNYYMNITGKIAQIT